MPNISKNKNPLKLYLTDFSFSRFYGMKFPIIVTKEIFSNRVQVPHLHDFVHIWYCIDGNYTHIVGNNKYICKKGSIVIVPPGTTHELYPNEKEDITLMSVDIAYTAFLDIDTQKYINTLAHLLLPAFSNELSLKLSTFYQLSEQSQKSADTLLSELTLAIPLDSANNEKILGILETFFNLPEFHLDVTTREKTTDVMTTRVLPILISTRYLNENFQKKLYTNSLMKISALCQTNFCMYFRKLLGMSASIYLQRLRVARAMFFLAHTNYNIHYISDYCGFNSPSHMIYCFKKHAQMVPKQSRNSFIKYLHDFPEKSLNVSLD